MKFKVYDEKYGMFEVGYIDYVNNEASYFVDWDHKNNCMIDEWEVEWKTAPLTKLRKYTGVNAQDGTEVYTGDIVLMADEFFDPSEGESPTYLNTVEWSDEFCSFMIRYSRLPGDIELLGEYDTYILEVVGNLDGSPYFWEKD